MREYGQIQSSYWNSPKVHSWSTEGKLLGTYLLTGPHTISLGCMRIPVGYVMADLNWSAETVSKGFAELFRSGFIDHDLKAEWVLLPQFLEWNPIANPNVAIKIAKEFMACSSSTIKRRFSLTKSLLKSFPIHKGPAISIFELHSSQEKL